MSSLLAPLVELSAAEAAESESSALSGTVLVVAYIFSNTFSSVFICLCLKEVFARGFGFPMTVAAISYGLIYLYYKVLEWTGLYVPKGSMPLIENIKVALSSVAAISFMNLCLLTNTVAIYQIGKFAIIPCTLLIQKSVYGVETNWRVLLSLVLLLSGVGYATMTSFDAGTMPLKGVIFAVLGVLSSSFYRIWQGMKQKEFKIGPVDFQATMAGWQFLLGVVFCVPVEFFPVEKDETVVNYFIAAYNDGFGGQFASMLPWLLGVCISALTVNFTMFGLIGRTGPVAYAVVGHAKTVLTIIMGIEMFPGSETSATIFADIWGCGVALVGAIGYAHFEYCTQKKQPDVVERTFPFCFPKKTVVAPTNGAP